MLYFVAWGDEGTEGKRKQRRKEKRIEGNGKVV